MLHGHNTTASADTPTSANGWIRSFFWCFLHPLILTHPQDWCWCCSPMAGMRTQIVVFAFGMACFYPIYHHHHYCHHHLPCWHPSCWLREIVLVPWCICSTHKSKRRRRMVRHSIDGALLSLWLSLHCHCHDHHCHLDENHHHSRHWCNNTRVARMMFDTHVRCLVWCWH